jgi:arylsulfatase A-like enzyme
MIAQLDDPAMFRMWHQMFVEDVTMSEVMRDSAYTTSITADTYHLWGPGKNFSRGFDSFHWVRGQEADHDSTGPVKGINPLDWVHRTQAATGGAGQVIYLYRYLSGRSRWQTEEDWPSARLYRQAADWLRLNTGQTEPFYQHIECYSPHEFWDPPEDWYRVYMKSNYSGPRLINPPMDARVLSPVELEHARALYRGLLSFMDYQLGFYLDAVESLGLMENTIICLTSDHGVFLGEGNQLRKSEGTLRTQLTNVPLMIYHPRHPEWAGRRVSGLVQHTDTMPTLLDLLGIQVPGRSTGRSLRPELEANQNIQRDYIVGGWGDHGFVRTQDWHMVNRWNPGTPDNTFQELYDLRKDPRELNNVFTANPSVVADLMPKLTNYVEQGREYVKGSFAKVLLPAYR